MSGRIDVDRSLPPVAVPAIVWNELRSHALETVPEECCGLLLGKAAGFYETVVRCRNEMTRLHQEDPLSHPRDGREAFHMNEMDYVRIEEQAREERFQVTGVYHSHVGVGAYFSELDQAFALEPLFPFPGADHVVISVVEHRVRDIAVFRPVRATGGFEGRVLSTEAP
ncbi:MAG: Mov34/MPN/PAD-1 family protein [Deltaproteobacteria bacterium]|nr:Mov34/MPN/PAD-1 family protein [Deltaproteobacteria bacterium]MBW2395027.1 Mov34/MPN/PAD-1 family protein [Deltaproteobacteria bacterium]